MSATSLGALFGMRREFFPDAFDAENLPWIVPVLSGVESVFGTVLVFLLLLLRNRFRIKKPQLPSGRRSGKRHSHSEERSVSKGKPTASTALTAPPSRRRYRASSG